MLSRTCDIVIAQVLETFNLTYWLPQKKSSRPDGKLLGYLRDVYNAG